jgi:hypothetical protein
MHLNESPCPALPDQCCGKPVAHGYFFAVALDREGAPCGKPPGRAPATASHEPEGHCRRVRLPEVPCNPLPELARPYSDLISAAADDHKPCIICKKTEHCCSVAARICTGKRFQQILEFGFEGCSAIHKKPFFACIIIMCSPAVLDGDYCHRLPCSGRQRK